MRPVLITLIIFMSSTLRAQLHHPRFLADTISVTGSYLYTTIADSLPASYLLTQEEITALPGNSIADLLGFMGCIDTQVRGLDGVQTDFSIRGSSFEQVIVMVDNIIINDPQTGHHNSDIPVPLPAIQQIEILPSPVSCIYGSYGSGGVINIITNSHLSDNKTRLKATLGSFGRQTWSASQSWNTKQFALGIALERKKSNGYRPVTDYSLTTASINTKLNYCKKSFTFYTGFTDKNFGANGFYAPYPSREKTKALHTRISFDLQVNPLLFVTSDIFGRWHNDDFILDKNQPQWYRNKHTSTIAGFRIQTNYIFRNQNKITVGVERITESMQSKTLGNHERNKLGIFSEIIFPLLHNVTLNSGIRADLQNKGGINISPFLGGSYAFTPKIKGWITTGTIFRLPTFTELYYASPANLGDPDLHPEKGWSLDMGLSRRHSRGVHKISVFSRVEKNRIDWMRKQKSDPWQATNIANLSVTGLSVSILYNCSTFIQVTMDNSLIIKNPLFNSQNSYKYCSSLLHHNLIFKTHFKWLKGLNQVVIWNLKQRVNNHSFSLISSKISYSWDECTVFMEACNLTNTRYEEIPDIPLPGCNLNGGVEFSL